MSKFTFDMPHALVTLTDVEGNVELEVWPKAGQSAYVVVPPPIARLIAERIALMADAAEQGEAERDEGRRAPHRGYRRPRGARQRRGPGEPPQAELMPPAARAG